MRCGSLNNHVTRTLFASVTDCKLGYSILGCVNAVDTPAACLARESTCRRGWLQDLGVSHTYTYTEWQNRRRSTRPANASPVPPPVQHASGTLNNHVNPRESLSLLYTKLNTTNSCCTHQINTIVQGTRYTAVKCSEERCSVQRILQSMTKRSPHMNSLRCRSALGCC